MIRIEFPNKGMKMRKENDVFDEIRKKWVELTEEEWVRQNILQYLESKGYPSKLIAVEKEIRLGELKKRCDIVVYDRNTNPWMIIECKKMKTQLNATVLDQALRYHLSIPCPYIFITNGRHCYGFQKLNGELVEINDFPSYSPPADGAQ